MKLLCAGLVPFAAWLAVLAAAPVCGQDQSSPERSAPPAKQSTDSENAQATRPEDRAAVEAASQAFVKAFETGDVQAVAALFTEGAEYIDEENEPVRGRAALAKAYESLFAKRKQLKAESTTDAIDFLSHDSARQAGTFTVTAKDTPPNATRFSALYVREGGKWLIALMKEWGDDKTDKPSLQDLDWLIGTWESSGGDLTARTTYEWTANKTFIKAHFSITSKDAKDLPSSGTQIIGIDPALGHIRAWLFASDGSVGESSWAWDDRALGDPFRGNSGRWHAHHGREPHDAQRGRCVHLAIGRTVARRRTRTRHSSSDGQESRGEKRGAVMLYEQKSKRCCERPPSPRGFTGGLSCESHTRSVDFAFSSH